MEQLRFFSYEESKLTEEQKEQIARAKAMTAETLKHLEEEENERMERYYNCEDDYSWGGPCSKANYIARDRAKQELEEAIESIVRGGFIIRVRKVNVLKEKETGEVVAAGLHDGKYGPYFSVNDGEKYIGFAKQVSTFEKKGYLPFVQTVTEKLRPNGWWRYSGDRRYDILETLSVTEEVSTERYY